MKLVSNVRRTSLKGIGYAVLLAFMLAPLSSKANGHEQPQPKPQQVQQEAQDFSKTIKKEFPISANGLVGLDNKYGKLDVKTWEKNRVKIDVTIVVKANSESAAQDVFNRINIEFSNGDDFVKAQTVIETMKSSWWSWGDKNCEFQINYEVFMPASGSVSLTNKYGDTFVQNIAGTASFDVKYGSFKADGIGGNLNISLGYGNGTVVKAKDATVDLSYSNLNLNQVGNVNLTTKYSKITVDKGQDIMAVSRYDEFYMPAIQKFNCQSRYGKVEIGSAESVIAVSRYTDYNIGKLGDNGDFDLQYGSMKVDKLARGFSNVNLVGKYTDFKILVEPEASYTLEADANYAGVAYPRSLDVTFEKDKGTSHQVKGYSGTQGARSIIKASLSYGGLKVQ